MSIGSRTVEYSIVEWPPREIYYVIKIERQGIKFISQFFLSHEEAHAWIKENGLPVTNYFDPDTHKFVGLSPGWTVEPLNEG